MKTGIKINKDKIKTSLKEKMKINKKALKNGTYSMTYTLILITVIVVINLITAEIPEKYTQIDVSSQKLYTISDDTVEFLNELDQDVVIYLVVQSGNEDDILKSLSAAVGDLIDLCNNYFTRFPKLLADKQYQQRTMNTLKEFQIYISKIERK